jgi:hypothetical protein
MNKVSLLDLFILLFHVGLLIVSIVTFHPVYIAAHSILFIEHFWKIVKKFRR